MGICSSVIVDRGGGYTAGMTASDVSSRQNPYRAPSTTEAVAAAPVRPSWGRLKSVPGVFFATAAVVAVVLAVRFGWIAVRFGRQGLPNYHLAAIKNDVMAISLVVVAVIASGLALGVFTFRSNAVSNSETRFTRVASIAAVVCLVGLGGLVTIEGGRQGIILLMGCAIWTSAVRYERNRDDQATFRGMRWMIRVPATVFGLSLVSASASLLFDAVHLINRLHLYLPGPEFPRGPGDIPESNFMVFGQLIIGVPYAVLGVLLLRQVFCGLMLAREQSDG